MIWELFYDFILLMTDGSEWATLSADILALVITLLFIYFLVIFPLQLIIRSIIRWISIFTATPTFYSFRRKFNKKPKYSKRELEDQGDE